MEDQVLVPIVGLECEPVRSVMVEPEDVAEMLRLTELGWGARAIARELGVSRNTVRRYVRQGGWQPYQQPQRVSALDGHEEWLREQLVRHSGNAEVVRQELVTDKGIDVSLRTVERAVVGFRRELKARQKATVRFETAPGRQLQADFGQTSVMIGGVKEKVHLCVLTLGYSRRLFVQPHRHERQENWLQTFEAAFMHFSGVPRELLLDNARALVKSHNRATREVVFNERLSAFCRYWGVTPKACAPYRPRTKGKDERSVGYVKRNAVAGREFCSWEAFEQHLERWTRDIADQRNHGTVGERPIERFERDEAKALLPLAGRLPYESQRELVRKVATDLCVDVDTNRYSVPWRLIGETVTVRVDEHQVQVWYAGGRVAEHRRAAGSRQMTVEPSHFDGITAKVDDDRRLEPEPTSFVADLGAYEAVVTEVCG